MVELPTVYAIHKLYCEAFWSCDYRWLTFWLTIDIDLVFKENSDYKLHNISFIAFIS